MASPIDGGGAAPPAIALDFVNIPTGQAAAALHHSPAAGGGASPQQGQSAAAPAAAVDASFGLLSLLSPSFWLAVFAVDTDEVKARLIASLWPFQRNFFEVLRGKPDLYIPLWGPATLVWLLQLGSNAASYMQFSASETVPIWRSDFSKLIEAAFVVYGFSIGAPALAWLATLYLGLPAVGVVSLVCLYGYSLVAFIPAALLCILPSAIIQWSAVMAATALSTYLVLGNVTRVTVEAGYPLSSPMRGLLALQLCAHVAFGVCLKLFFFTFSPAR